MLIIIENYYSFEMISKFKSLNKITEKTNNFWVENI